MEPVFYFYIAKEKFKIQTLLPSQVLLTKHGSISMYLNEFVTPAYFSMNSVFLLIPT